MKAVFSRQFKADLLDAESKYREISDRLASAFHERVSGQAREVIKWKGGDHVGPHGFPCRRTKPFPFYLYYEIREDVIYFLALVPDLLKARHKDPTGH